MILDSITASSGHTAGDTVVHDGDGDPTTVNDIVHDGEWVARG
ncbi:hypothetical protein [Mycolicibacterium goodii]|nr:hypothetical protein [Mycolicibacterium goodii]